MPLLFDLSSSSFAIFNIPFLLSSPTRIVIRAKVFEPAFIIIFLKLAKKGREGKREKGNKQWLEQWETKEREEERARIYNTFEFCYVHRSNKRESGLRARSIDRCHASIVWLNFTRESGARSTLELEHTQGLGTEVISPVSDFQSRQWSLLFDDLASRSCSGSVSKKKKMGGCRVEPRRFASTPDQGAIDLRSLLHIRRLSLPTIPFVYPLSLPDASIFHVFFPTSSGSFYISF